MRSAVLLLLEWGYASGRFQLTCVNELGNVVAGGQADMNGMFRPRRSIIIFEPLSQSVSRDTDDGIHLRIKGFRAPEGMHRNAVLLDFADGSFEILFANKCQKSSRVVRPPKYLGRQDVVHFSPFRLKFADRPLQASTPENDLSTATRLCGEYNRIFRRTTQGQIPVISSI